MPQAIYLIWDSDLSKFAYAFRAFSNYDLSYDDARKKVDIMNKDMIDSDGYEGDRWKVVEYVLNHPN
jgi:hypothetical protein